MATRTHKVDDPFQVCIAGDWEWRILKHYQNAANERKNPYARVFCAVRSPMTYGDWEYGDTYCTDIPEYDYDWKL